MTPEPGTRMEFITEYWQPIMAFIFVVVWGVRLEGRVSRLDKQRSEDLAAARESREATNLKLDRLDDKLDRAFQEVRNDIKALYQQGVAR